ncbi:MAG: malonyl-CoA synthase [Pseudomonadota bacterium]
MPDPTTLLDLMRHAGTPETAPFLETGDGRRISYGAMWRMSAQMAHTLVDFGVKPGDRVAVQVGKSPEALILYLACFRAGAVYLPLNTAYTHDELDHFLRDAAPSLVICAPQDMAAIDALKIHNQPRVTGLAPDGSGPFTALSEGQPESFDDQPRGPDDLAALLYTSGTTGRSKGAMLSHWNLASNALTLRDLWRFTSDDVLLHALPIYHTHGLFVATNVVLLAGASMLFLPKFDPDDVFRLLPRATSMMGVPTFYTRLLDDPRLTRETVNSMRVFISGSAPLLAQTHDAFRERTGHAILERYGMTETGMNTSNPYDQDRCAGTVGFPLPDVGLRITDPETGTERPQGETGMIEVSGPNVFSGYWNLPDKTHEEFRDDGFFITGDLGLIDTDGYVHIVGRAKDLVITGGFNVYPKEIELLIDALDGVMESAVFGVPHPDFGEAVTAAVVLDAGANLSVADIEAALVDRLAKFKQPKRVLLVDALPRNAMGKVQKTVLRDTHASLFKA